MNSEQLILQKIIQAGLLNDGDQICYQNEQGVLTKAGTVFYEEKHFPSVSEWIFDVSRRMGFTEDDYPWTKASVRGLPLENYRARLAEADGVVPDTKQNGLTDFRTSRSHSSGSNRKRKNDSGESASYDEDSDTNRKQRKLNGGDVTQHRYTNDAGSFQSSPSASCKYPNCMVCNKGLPSHFNTQSPTWADILQVVLYALGVSHPQKEFFSLGKEIYDYIDVHWDKLSAKPRSSTWKQTAKMTLAHSRYANLFENGYDIFMKTGFWRLKKQSNPYEMSGISGTSRPSNDIPDRAEELPSEESDHELRADRSWESTGSKLNSPPAYKINYLLAENAPQAPSIPNLSAYSNSAMQMPPPPIAPQFYNAYNSFQKPQMNSPPPQFNSIKPNDFISQPTSSSNFYPSMAQNNNPVQNMPQLPHAFFSRRFSVDEGAKTLEDLRNASSFGVPENESNFYPQQHRLPDVNNNPINHIESNGAPVQEMVMNNQQIKDEQLDAAVQKQQASSANASPTQVPVAPPRRRSVQYDSTNNFVVPESRSTLRTSANPLMVDGYVNTNGAAEQYQRSISLEDELKSKNQLISKLYEELDSYKKHSEGLRHTLDERDRMNKELSNVVATLQAQLQKEQESAQMYQQVAKYNEEQRIRLETVYKQMNDLMGRPPNRSPDQMRQYPFGSGIMNVAATPNGDARSGGFQSSGKMSPGDIDNLRYS